MTLIVCRIQPALRGQASFLMEKFRLLHDHLVDSDLTGELSYENPRRKGLAKPGVTEDGR